MTSLDVSSSVALALGIHKEESNLYTQKKKTRYKKVDVEIKAKAGRPLGRDTR